MKRVNLNQPILENLNYSDLRKYFWSKGDLEYKLWDQQKPIYDTVHSLPITSQTIVFLCARQFGKSVLGVALALEDCLKNENISVMLVAPEIKHTRSIVNPRLRMITNDAPEGLVNFIKSEDRWIIGSSEIILGGFDVKNASRVRGKTLFKIYIEEIVESDSDALRESIRSDLAPALTHSTCPQIIYLTTLPKVPDHYFITNIIPEAMSQGAFFKYTIKDNKKLTPEQYEACVKRSGGEDSVEFRREYMCELVRDQSITVIPHFDKHHVQPFELPLSAKYTITIDFGGVRDKTVALLHTYDYFTNQHLIIDEAVFDANTPTDYIVKELRDLEEGFEIDQRISDCPGQLLIDLNSIHGYTVVMPNKTDWRASVNQMSVLFSTNNILIHPRCEFLALSCRSGTFNKTKTDFDRTFTLGHCDALAALMYAIRSQNTENPYEYVGGRSDNFWVPEKHDDSGLKTFGQRKKFGVFQ